MEHSPEMIAAAEGAGWRIWQSSGDSVQASVQQIPDQPGYYLVRWQVGDKQTGSSIWDSQKGDFIKPSV